LTRNRLHRHLRDVLQDSKKEEEDEQRKRKKKNKKGVITSENLIEELESREHTCGEVGFVACHRTSAFMRVIFD
jgi:hypothetical protein